MTALFQRELLFFLLMELPYIVLPTLLWFMFIYLLCWWLHKNTGLFDSSLGEYIPEDDVDDDDPSTSDDDIQP